MKKGLLLMMMALWTAAAALAQLADDVPTRQRRAHRPDEEPAAQQETKLRRVGLLATAPLGSTGQRHVPVILVQFDDLKFTIGGGDPEALRENYQKFFAGTGVQGEVYRPESSRYGSVADFFVAQSDSLFQPQFQVFGPVTLSADYAYYGEGRSDRHITEFYGEACRLAVEQSEADWTRFDNDQDGRVDAVVLIYAGEGENGSDDTNTIWPKQQNLTTTAQPLGKPAVAFNSYVCACELFGGAQDGIGQVCHELGHALGLPDLYGASSTYGMDYWDMMDSGCYQLAGRWPCGYSAYERDFFGWKPLATLPAGQPATLTLWPVSEGGEGYKILNDGQPSGTEYYILENRQNSYYDRYLGCNVPNAYVAYGAAHGLLITHVDYNQSSWTGNVVNSTAGHPRLTVVPADGTLVSSARGTSQDYYTSFRGDVYPGNQQVTAFNAEAPTAAPYVGSFTQTITAITEHSDGSITVDINGGNPDAILAPAAPGGSSLLFGDATDGSPASSARTSSRPSSLAGYYTPSGQRLSTPQRGLNIIRYPDGTTRKVMAR